MFTSKLRLIAKARPSRASTTSTDSGLDCKYEKPKCKALSANINEDHQSSGTVSYADALKGPQSPKAESLAGDIDNGPQSSKTASLSRDADDEPQSPQPPKRSANSISFRSHNRQPYWRHINPWIATLQYRVSALVNSIEIAQANALPFRNHADLGEPLPFVMEMRFAASLVRSNMRLVAEWIRELQMKGLPQFVGLEEIVNRLYFFWEHWGVRNHDPQLVGRIQCLISYLVGLFTQNWLHGDDEERQVILADHRDRGSTPSAEVLRLSSFNGHGHYHVLIKATRSIKPWELLAYRYGKNQIASYIRLL